ncbi:MAG: nicotinate-nucleotide adenylyltransferase [Myxococcota bacterium]|jgi:nicotinate-nucleotide adenylyltransferase|nr:nicotinate-nucleotide adenylyltransferase [Myxococcota bacterium]
MSRADAQRIGIYGGTFNPVHEGHLKAAREVARQLDLDCVVFVPSATPPHKSAADDDPIAPAHDRFAWVEAATRGEDGFEVSDVELVREGKSYTIDTLQTLTERFAPARLVFLIGHDAFVEMGAWRAPAEILALVDIAVVARPPVEANSLEAWLPDFARDLVEVEADGHSARHRETGTRIDVLEIGALDISASQIRDDLAHNRPIDRRVPEAVLAMVRQSGYYSRVDAAPTDSPDNPKPAPQQPITLEDEEQARKLALVVDAALERNAQEPVALYVRELTSYTDCVLVVSGNSQRQLRAISDSIVKALKAAGDGPLGVEGGSDTTWMLIDANDVIVHVFQPDTRELFDIEGLWEDAPRVALELPDGSGAEPANRAEA